MSLAELMKVRSVFIAEINPPKTDETDENIRNVLSGLNGLPIDGVNVTNDGLGILRKPYDGLLPLVRQHFGVYPINPPFPIVVNITSRDTVDGDGERSIEKQLVSRHINYSV